MKIFKLSIFLILIISCSDKKTEHRISEFDKVLGNDNVATLDLLTSDFENDFLKRQYPNLNTEKAYQKFLTDLRDGKTDNWQSVSKKARKTFKSSELRLEMYEFPDSVWILENSTFDKIESDSLNYMHSRVPYIKSRFRYINQDGTTEYTYSRSSIEFTPNPDYDSIINRELITPEVNYIGKYLQALKSIKDKSEFHKEYYERKSNAGFLPSESTSQFMLYKNIDLNDKLNRGIIVLEFIY